MAYIHAAKGGGKAVKVSGTDVEGTATMCPTRRTRSFVIKLFMILARQSIIVDDVLVSGSPSVSDKTSSESRKDHIPEDV